MKRAGSYLVLALMLLASGCGEDFDRTRRDHAADFPAELAASSNAILAGRGPLDLDDCIAIALEESLAIRRADLAERLAAIDEDIAFGSFLPVIQVEWRSFAQEHPTEVEATPGTWQEMSDASQTRASVSLRQPLFVPQAWFLYQAVRDGADISALVAERVRQQIALRVAEGYYRCLADREALTQAEAGRDQARELVRVIRARQRAGLATPADVEAATALHAARDLAATNHRRRLARDRAALGEAMGLDPFAPLALAADSAPPPPPPPPLDEVLTDALLHRLELGVADRTIAVRRHEVRMALVAWLPNLFGFGEASYTSDSFQHYATNATIGLGAVMTVLDGLRQVGRYRAAENRQVQAEVAREQCTLAILLTTHQAHLAATEAVAAYAVAAYAHTAARTAHRQTTALAREGLITDAERLEAVAALARARSQEITARYHARLAAFALRDARGYGRGSRATALDPHPDSDPTPDSVHAPRSIPR